MCIPGMAKTRFPKTGPYWPFMVPATVHRALHVPSFYCMSLDHDGLLSNAASWPLRPLRPFKNVMQRPCKHAPAWAQATFGQCRFDICYGKKKRGTPSARDVSHLTSEKS